MKLRKFAAAVVAALCMVTACGCAGANTSTDSTASTESTPAVEQPEEPADEIDTTLTPMEFTAQIRVGWNLGNTLDATGTGLSAEKSWGNPRTTPELIAGVKAAGFNAVRIPTSWGNHMDEAHNIDPEWMARVKEVVDYAYDLDMYVILNMHHEEWNFPYYDNEENGKAILTHAWTQIAEQFKGYDERLIFEGMNEPRWQGTNFEWNGGNQEGWDVVNIFNQTFVDAVRATGGNNEHRFLMVCPYAANSGETALAALKLPDDDRLIVSVHAYIPYNFALAETGSPMWVEEKPVCTGDIDTLADVLDRLFISKGIAVIIGETGAQIRYTNESYIDEFGNEVFKPNDEYRAAWAEYYFGKFKALGIPCFWWDNGAFTSGEKFGLFNRYSGECRAPIVLEGIMKGAGE